MNIYKKKNLAYYSYIYILVLNVVVVTWKQFCCHCSVYIHVIPPFSFFSPSVVKNFIAETFLGSPVQYTIRLSSVVFIMRISVTVYICNINRLAKEG